MNIYVRNISFKAKESEVKALFEKYGTVQDFKLIKDKQTGKSRGFGFVIMADKDAREAINALDGFTLNGRELYVVEAEERSRK